MQKSEQQLSIKLTIANITKRVRDTPETFEALKNQVKAQMCKGKRDSQYIKSDEFQIVYEDATGNVINVSDDKDLLAAYEVAESLLGK